MDVKQVIVMRKKTLSEACAPCAIILPLRMFRSYDCVPLNNDEWEPI